MCAQWTQTCLYVTSFSSLFVCFFPPHSTAPYKNLTQPPLVVADMMAGVGPFAVPLSMAVNFNTTVADREIKVHANGESYVCGIIVLSSKFLVIFRWLILHRWYSWNVFAQKLSPAFLIICVMYLLLQTWTPRHLSIWRWMHATITVAAACSATTWMEGIFVVICDGNCFLCVL